MEVGLASKWRGVVVASFMGLAMVAQASDPAAVLRQAEQVESSTWAQIDAARERATLQVVRAYLGAYREAVVGLQGLGVVSEENVVYGGAAAPAAVGALVGIVLPLRFLARAQDEAAAARMALATARTSRVRTAQAAEARLARAGADGSIPAREVRELLTSQGDVSLQVQSAGETAGRARARFYRSLLRNGVVTTVIVVGGVALFFAVEEETRHARALAGNTQTPMQALDLALARIDARLSELSR